MSPSTRCDILRVDLTARRVTRERVPVDWRRGFLGGKGLGARYLHDELDAGVDPLGPDNALALFLGPLSGYLPGESRYAVVTKSPLTGTFLDSYSGGSFADALAGALPEAFGLFVTGRAERPVRLDVEDGTASIEPAYDLWGADTEQTDAEFPDAAVACVGPAGESWVRYATISSDGGDHHAGRGGAGAVMGSKRLKAVVVRGDPPSGLDDLRETYDAAYREDDTGRWHAASGTVESIDFANEVGVLSTRGWQSTHFEDADDIGIEAARDAATEREDVEGGSVPGGFRVETDDGETVPRGGALMSLGAGLGLDEFDAVTTLGATCDRLGVDVISAGNAVAWAMRAAEDGVIDRSLAFGDGGAARTLLQEIAGRDSELGDVLADGVAAAREQFDAEGIPTVKSMELPAYDPRGAAGMALAYATSDRGGCHRRARPIEREVFDDEWSVGARVAAVADAQRTRSVLWSLVADDFTGETLWDDLGAEWLAAVGLDYDHDELERVGERIWTLVRLFNAREGFDRADDELPELFERPVSDGPGEGRTLDRGLFERMLDAYYDAWGWSRDGLPTRAAVTRLGLRDAVDESIPLGTDTGEYESEVNHD